jgi:outer membrane protein assembly factor BamB
MHLRPCLAFAALIAVAASALAGNWPAWRGPRGDGVTTETELPLIWSATENVRWKIPLPEPGNSTPIVWDDRVFFTQAEGERRTLWCISRGDGKRLWEAGPTWKEQERTHQTNPFCASSPVTDGERIIAWFGSAGLWCWNLDGKELWHIDLGKQDHEWGYGSSPVLAGDLCILNFGPGERSFVVGIEKKSGRETWRFDVPPPKAPEGPGVGNKYIGSWSTPVLMEEGGRTQLLVALPGAVFALDPQTGKELWHCDGLNPLAYANVLVGDTAVVGLGGFGGYAIGIKRGGFGDVTATHRLWQEKQSPQRIGSGVVLDGRAFMPSDAGIVQCLDPQTGKVLWQERPQVPGGQASTWSSIVLSGDRLYLPTKNSDTIVMRAGPKFEQLAVNSLGDGMMNASPAISDRQIFLRTHRHLWCIGAP